MRFIVDLSRMRHAGFLLVLAIASCAAAAQTGKSALPDDPSLPGTPPPAAAPQVASVTEPADLPDAPGWSSSLPAQEAAQKPESSAQKTAGQDPAAIPPPSGDPATPHQTKRIFGVIPNYRSVSADQKLPPQTVKDKFVAAGHDSFDYGSFILAAVQAGFSIDGNAYPEFGKGVLGYGRYYWRTLLDTADENFMVGGVLPAVLHQDSRFYTLGHGSIAHRALYASSRILITRQDDGSAAPNYSEIIGAGAASGISSTYYPERYRTWTKVGQKWLTSVLIDSGNFTFKEFWPDINQKLFHGKSY